MNTVSDEEQIAIVESALKELDAQAADFAASVKPGDIVRWEDSSWGIPTTHTGVVAEVDNDRGRIRICGYEEWYTISRYRFHPPLFIYSEIS